MNTETLTQLALHRLWLSIQKTWIMMRSYTWRYAAVYKGVVKTSIITSWNTSDQQQWVLLDFCCTAADFKTPDGGLRDLITSLTSAPLHSQHVGSSSLFSGPTPLSLTMWSPLQRHFYKRHCGADKEWEKPESGCRGPVGWVSLQDCLSGEQGSHPVCDQDSSFYLMTLWDWM